MRSLNTSTSDGASYSSSSCVASACGANHVLSSGSSHSRFRRSQFPQTGLFSSQRVCRRLQVVLDQDSQYIVDNSEKDSGRTSLDGISHLDIPTNVHGHTCSASRSSSSLLLRPGVTAHCWIYASWKKLFLGAGAERMTEIVAWRQRYVRWK